METTTNYKTIQEASEITGLGERQILYRVRKGQIDAKKMGWIWLITEKGMEQLKFLSESDKKRYPDGLPEVE